MADKVNIIRHIKERQAKPKSLYMVVSKGRTVFKTPSIGEAWGWAMGQGETVPATVVKALWTIEPAGGAK